MSETTKHRVPVLERWLWVFPAAALGLYAGRLLSELLRAGLVVAIATTIVTLAMSFFVVRRRSFWFTWPLLLLSFYVFYPEPDPRIAAAAGLATALAWIQSAEPLKLPQIMTCRTADALTGMLLFVGSVAIYVNTLSPDLLAADAGELQLVAAKWGVAHPTGFPLYTILANLATRLPLGPNPAYRANLLSAVTSSAALLFIYLSVRRLTQSRLAGLLGAAALGFSTTYWSQATTANVRSLTALFTAAAFYLLLLLHDRERQPAYNSSQDASADASDSRDHGRLWLMALFVLVLVSAVSHHTSLVFIGAIFALYAVAVQPAFRKPRRWPVLLLAALIALLPLLYLPLRGAAGAIGAPADLATLQGFLNHILGLGFRGDFLFFDDLSVLWARLMVMINVFTFQFTPLVLLTMLVGLILLFFRDKLLGVVLAISIVSHTLVAAVYRAPQTVEYMLPAYVLMAILFGYFGGYCRRYYLSIQPRDLRGRLTNALAISFVTAMIVMVLAQSIQNFTSYRQLSHDKSARDYAQPLLREAPRSSVILADWHWATPLWYLQHVEGLRPDVDVAFVYPESGPYADTWATRIADELADGRDVISTHFEPAAFSLLPPAEPLHEAFLYRQQPLYQLPSGYETVQSSLGPGLFVEGYRLPVDAVEAGQELTLQLAWRSQGQLDQGSTLYAHLIGPDGRLYASDDQPARANAEALAFNQFRLTPLLHTPPGLYDLVIGSYSAVSTEADSALSLTQVQVEPSKQKQLTSNPVFRPMFDTTGKLTLVGYDWDSTFPGRQRLYLHWSTPDGYVTQVEEVDGGPFALPSWYGPWGVKIENTSLSLDRPASYVPFGQGIVWLGQARDENEPLLPGGRVKLIQEFAAGRPILHDLVVSLRLVGYQPDGQSWAWWDLDDGVPAMGAIPTLKWIAGSRVDHPVWPTISPDAQDEQEIEPLLLLYDAFTSRQLPILDERFAQQAPWLALGR